MDFMAMCCKVHTQPFNGPLSGTTRVSRYQKKHSPTHAYEEEEEGFTQTTSPALSQRGLLDPIKPAYNQSGLYGRLRLTASAFNWLWISMPTVLVAVPTVMQNSLHPLSTSSIIARRLLDFMQQGKITEADAPTIRLDATPSWLSVPPPPSSPIFTWNAIFVTTVPIYPGLGQALNNDGLHSQWLVYVLQRNIMFFDICSFSSVIKQQSSSEDVLSFFTVMVRNRQRGHHRSSYQGQSLMCTVVLFLLFLTFLGTVIV